MSYKHTKNGLGYLVTPKNKTRKIFYVHRLIAEKVLGHKLKKENIVHHVNGDRSDNRNENLVICENSAYHRLLHKRKIAFLNCGHANWHKCFVCKRWSPIGEIYIPPLPNRTAYHNDCINKYNKENKNGNKVL